MALALVHTRALDGMSAPEVVVDGNVERVMARLFRVEDPMPASKPALRDKAATLTPPARART